MNNKDLFPGVHISEPQRVRWEMETQKIREAWELGKERAAHRTTRVDTAPYRTVLAGKAFV